MPRTTTLTLNFSGALLREAREKAGMYQQMLADRCGELGRAVDRSQISRFETGEKKPNPPDLKVLAAALEVTIDDLLAKVAA